MNANLIEFTAWISQNAFNLFIQSTALILLGLLAARGTRRYGSAVQSAIYRATLVAVFGLSSGRDRHRSARFQWLDDSTSRNHKIGDGRRGGATGF